MLWMHCRTRAKNSCKNICRNTMLKLNSTRRQRPSEQLCSKAILVMNPKIWRINNKRATKNKPRLSHLNSYWVNRSSEIRKWIQAVILFPKLKISYWQELICLEKKMMISQKKLIIIWIKNNSKSMLNCKQLKGCQMNSLVQTNITRSMMTLIL